jgi:hypothetical protein
MVKMKRMRWEAYVARMGRERHVQSFWWENLRVRDQWGDPGVDGRILRWVFRKWDVVVWTGPSWLRIGSGGGQL